VIVTDDGASATTSHFWRLPRVARFTERGERSRGDRGSGATSWIALDPAGLGSGLGSYFPIVLDPQTPATIYMSVAYTGGILKSTTGGQ
jgi:hypothetical protein